MPFQPPKGGQPFQPHEQVTMPPRSPAQETIDHVLTNPVLAQELRTRGIITRPQRRNFTGGRWTANKDGYCEKALGWQITDAGRLLERECGAEIKAGESCWRQGFKFYGQGCHGKNIIILPRGFAEEVIAHPTWATNLPDRRHVLELACRLWDQDVKAGLVEGEWGTDERKASVEETLGRLREMLDRLEQGVILSDSITTKIGAKSLTTIRMQTRDESTLWDQATTPPPVEPVATQPPPARTRKKPAPKAVVAAPKAKRTRKG